VATVRVVVVVGTVVVVIGVSLRGDVG
jgi:hypothetical protein